MPDMEKDLENLRKAVKVKSPKLTDDVILDGITRQPATKPKRLQLNLAAGALTVVLAVGIGMNLTPRGPLFALGSGSSGAAESGLSLDGATDAKMAIWANYVYQAGPNLGTAGGNGNVYQLKLKGDPEVLIESLATRFDLEGEVSKESYDGNKTYSYFFGIKDNWEKPSVSVYWSGTGSWYLNNYTGATSGPGLPSEADAKAQALELFAATGLNVTADKLDVLNEYGMTVIGHLEVDGKPTALDWSMTWDQYGNLVAAGGNSVEVINRGNFQTVSEKDAVARISDWRYAGSPASIYFGGGIMTKDAAASTTDAVTSEPSTGEGTEPAPAPTSSPEPQPTSMPTAMPIEPPTINVVCTSAKAVPVMVWDSKGNAWLVPGYTFKSKELGWEPAVVSLVDGIIELPKADDRVVMY
ncbi:MAG: hypothetical protein RL683_888 [Actinomycetota bacterium]|jgi:hypothetical protein